MDLRYNFIEISERAGGRTKGPKDGYNNNDITVIIIIIIIIPVLRPLHGGRTPLPDDTVYTQYV